MSDYDSGCYSLRAMDQTSRVPAGERAKLDEKEGHQHVVIYPKRNASTASQAQNKGALQRGGYSCSIAQADFLKSTFSREVACGSFLVELKS